MDDFLHNLRSGKLKQPERPNRPYSDQQYKGGPRRNMNMMDRRKRENDNRESFERNSAIKEVLENLAESQKRLAQAYEARTAVESRKALAMEILAKNMYRILNPQATDIDRLFAVSAPVSETEQPPSQQMAESLTADSDNAMPLVETEALHDEEEQDEAVLDSADVPVTVEPSEVTRDSKRLSEPDRLTIISKIKEMRDNGDNWEQIARQVAELGYPTVSGKGSWRGIMAKNLYEKRNL